ncbi:RlpA-like double-psi beta-barrel domain-containing protein [Siccirubricoccus deserti]
MGAALMVLGIGAQDIIFTPLLRRSRTGLLPTGRHRATMCRRRAGRKRKTRRRHHGVIRRSVAGRATMARSSTAGGWPMAAGSIPTRTSRRTAPCRLARGRGSPTWRTAGAPRRVEDRGPHVRGRVIDLTPRTAKQLGMREQGTAPVEVRPIEVPETDQRVAER